jgi:tRNA (guanine37-N1)-methyltransferase
MRFDVLTIFPGMFAGYLNEGLLGKAITKGLVDIRLVDIRDFAEGPHRTTDDRPYGGGEGMVMKPEPIFEAVESVERVSARSLVILLSPQGVPFKQSEAWKLAELDQVIMVCGRYEGIDERVRMTCIDRELSIGDYVLNGGEVGAMVIIDSVSRLIPGVLGGERSTIEDSFEDGLLEYPQYTRPRTFREKEVPEVLLSGNHERIRKWRRAESLRRTLERRPDLLPEAELTDQDKMFLSEM